MPVRTTIAQWIKTSLPVDWDSLRAFTNEPVPNHLKRWWWCLGGTPAYLFLVQVVTGILLAFYYVPEPGRAYDSVRHISEDVAYGWYFRSLHKWSANLMIVAVILHVMRVFFTGAYRKPRELNWMFGVCILIVVLVFGFTGYSLVYEQLSYWGATVASNLTESVFMVGPLMARFIRGGETLGSNTLTRFYIFHIGVLPTLITLLLGAHILLVRLHGVTEFEFEQDRGKPKRTFPFFPDHLLSEMILGVGLMVLLTCLACIFPAELSEPADPRVTPAEIKPEWYFYFTFRWLKLTGLTFAVLSLGLAAFLLLTWPFVDRLIRRRNPESELSVWIGAAGVVAILALTVWEAIAPH
jgi:ubiquinol-cytochrome c reductase cytochrome b subunit/cytochrome b6